MTATVMQHPLRLVQLSSWQREGGAERVAVNLHEEFLAAGHDATLVVGGYSGHERQRRLTDRGIVQMPNDADHSGWTRTFWSARDRLRGGTKEGQTSPRRAMASVANMLAEPLRAIDRGLGREETRFPGARRLLDLKPDLIHGHNLHGSYFDLRLLPWLSRRVPVVLTLHDHWLLGGHCSYPFECERWKTGCGRCPHLDIYPTLRRDGTAGNWRRKAAIYADSRLYIATPCEWLHKHVQQSMLAPAVVESRVIPYGVDLNTFRPADNVAAVRAELGLRTQDRVLLYVANRLRTNPFKDFETLRTALPLIADAFAGDESSRLVFIALGDSGPSEQIGRAELRFVPFQDNPRKVARYYQAADLFLHAAKADNFPNTVLEALACGTPVVATAVGGIPEQVRDLGNEDATGALTPPGDASALAQRVIALLRDGELRRRLSHHAALDALSRFDLKSQYESYLRWFEQIVHGSAGRVSPDRAAVAARKD